MKKLIVMLLVLPFLVSCGLSNVEKDEASLIAQGVFYKEIATPGVDNRIASIARGEAIKAIDISYSARWLNEYKTQPIVKETIALTIVAPLAILKAAAYDLQTLNLPVYFTLGQHVLDGDAREALKVKAEILSRHPNTVLTIIGRASIAGKGKSNIKLSHARAKICKSMLVALGVDPSKVSVTYRGSADSITSLHEDQRVDFDAHMLRKDLKGHHLPPEGFGYHPVQTFPPDTIVEETIIKKKSIILPVAPAAPKG